MTKRRAEFASEPDEAESVVIENPVGNALRFTLMRLVRFMLTLACEVVAVAGACATGIWGTATLAWAGCAVLAVLMFTLGGAFDGDRSWINFYTRELYPFLERSPHPLLVWSFIYPFVVLVPSAIVMMVAWGQAVALGVPYRWENLPPGADVVLCEDCGAKIVDGLNCAKCRSFRPKYVVMRLIWGLNTVITTVWVAHDSLFGFIGFARGK